MTADPPWTVPNAVPGWEVDAVEEATLGVTVGVPAGWLREPATVDDLAVYRGRRGEHVALQAVDGVDVGRPLVDWMVTLFSLGGFPAPELTAVDDAARPELVEWVDLGGEGDFGARLDVDDLRLYEGLAVLAGRPAELARLYVVLARRGRRAWRISLSLGSACPPGAADELVRENDHVRAAATFAALVFHR